jgi:hypothetical protein
MSFGDEIAEWASQTQIEMYEEVADTTKELFKHVIKFSPKDTGRFLANWQVGSSLTSFSVPATSDYAPKLLEIDLRITPDFFMLNRKAYIFNNVDYVSEVEYEGWRVTPKYAPVAKSIAKMLR